MTQTEKQKKLQSPNTATTEKFQVKEQALREKFHLGEGRTNTAKGVNEPILNGYFLFELSSNFSFAWLELMTSLIFVLDLGLPIDTCQFYMWVVGNFHKPVCMKFLSLK
jgi:hypothetical protein